MQLTIVSTVLLGLILTPALDAKNTTFYTRIPVAGGSQVLTLNWYRHVATIEQKSTSGSWKTIWNYNEGLIASKVLPERACYISLMNRSMMPMFDALPRLAEQKQGLKGNGSPAKELTFTLTRRPFRDLKSYGREIFSMCRGLRSYVAYEYHGPEYAIRQASCNRLDVLQYLHLNYCRVNVDIKV